MHAEVSVDAGAVADGRFRGVAIPHRGRDGRFALERDVRPKRLAGVAVEAVDLPAIDGVGRPGIAEHTGTTAKAAGRSFAAVSAFAVLGCAAARPTRRSEAAGGVGERLGPFLFFRSGCRHDDLVADDDRRGPAVAGNLHFPGQVLGDTPFTGCLRLRGHARIVWPAELRPVAAVHRRRETRHTDA